MTRKKSRFGWRWIGIAAVLLVVFAVASAWNQQRAARQAAESIPPAGVTVEKPQSIPAQSAAGQRAGSAADARPERPTRERTDRPGGERLLDSEEVRSRAEQEFRAADRDGDGYLSRDEVRGRFPVVAKEFERVDADGDGRISEREFLLLRRARAERRLKK